MSLKKIILGNDFGYLIDNQLKNKIIDYLYSKIDLSNYRYCMLNTIQKLNFLQENIHYVSPNFKGLNYLLIMVIINNQNYCVIIDRKKLSYHKNQLNIKSLQIIQLKINIIENLNNDNKSNSLYNGTIIDGKLINYNNNYIFLIQDCLYLIGHKLTKMEMNVKIKYFNSIINNNFNQKINDNLNDDNLYDHLNNTNICMNFNFKLNKLYDYNDLNYLINNLNKIKLQTSGLIFYPKLSGINIIHIEKKIDKIDYTISNSNNEIIDNKSFNIIHNYVDFLKSRIYSYEYIDNNTNIKKLWLNKSTIPDVFYVYENNNDNENNKIGIALIPNLKLSHLCDNLINENAVQFNCIYCNKFKKWIPISQC